MAEMDKLVGEALAVVNKEIAAIPWPATYGQAEISSAIKAVAVLSAALKHLQ